MQDKTGPEVGRAGSMQQLLQQAARLVIPCYSMTALVQQVEQGTASQLPYSSFAGDGCQQLQRSQGRLAVVPQGLQACTYVKTEAAESLQVLCSSLKQRGAMCSTTLTAPAQGRLVTALSPQKASVSMLTMMSQRVSAQGGFSMYSGCTLTCRVRRPVRSWCSSWVTMRFQSCSTDRIDAAAA